MRVRLRVPTPYARPMDIALRGLGVGDIADWVRMLADVEAVDGTGEHYNEADLAEEMANPDIELGKDIVGAFVGDELVGFFGTYSRGESEGHLSVMLEGTVTPRRRGQGVGTVLVNAMLERAREVHREKGPALPARFKVTGLSANVEQERLLADHGLLPARWNFMMRVMLDQVPEPAPVPEGYQVRQYDSSMAAAMQAAHNVAFLDHPHFAPWTDTMWKQWVTESRNFRPDDSYLVVLSDDSTQIAAYVQTNEFDAYFEATGRREAYVAKVGTVREHRGRGLAGSLLQHCLAAYRDAGYDEASLDVDSENPTGALGIYRRAGFELETRWTNYVLTAPALR
jgi:mycothiol synthase